MEYRVSLAEYDATENVEPWVAFSAIAVLSLPS